MQKTKLGVTVGALGAITYFTGFFSGYTVAVLLAGYVLLFEENGWLKRSVVKSIVLLAFFSVTIGVINLIPDVIGFIDRVANVFNGNFSIAVVSRVAAVVVAALNILEKILFLGLGIKALKQETIPLMKT